MKKSCQACSPCPICYRKQFFSTPLRIWVEFYSTGTSVVLSLVVVLWKKCSGRPSRSISASYQVSEAGHIIFLFAHSVQLVTPEALPKFEQLCMCRSLFFYAPSMTTTLHLWPRDRCWASLHILQTIFLEKRRPGQGKYIMSLKTSLL